MEVDLGEQLVDELTETVDGVRIQAVKRSYIGLGFFVGAWAGGVLAAVVLIAIDTGYESQAVAGGVHIRDIAIALILVGSAAVSSIIGAALGAKFTPHDH
jgi:hypothetical protein